MVETVPSDPGRKGSLLGEDRPGKSPSFPLGCEKGFPVEVRDGSVESEDLFGGPGTRRVFFGSLLFGVGLHPEECRLKAKVAFFFRCRGIPSCTTIRWGSLNGGADGPRGGRGRRRSLVGEGGALPEAGAEAGAGESSAASSQPLSCKGLITFEQKGWGSERQKGGGKEEGAEKKDVHFRKLPEDGPAEGLPVDDEDDDGPHKKSQNHPQEDPPENDERGFEEEHDDLLPV